MKMLRAVAWVCCGGALCGCAVAPAPVGEPAIALPAPSFGATSAASFERRQQERALSAERQGRLADAALAWEILAVLRPDAGEYRERLADARRQIDAAVAERLQRASQAAKRGELDAAGAHYLAVLALQPDHAQAADALRGIERERNKRSYLGKYSRTTLTRRALADAEMAGAPRGSTRKPGTDRNDVEHAAMLAAQGDLDDAIGLLEARLAADKRDGAARQLLADVYYRKGERLAPRDKAAAIAALEKSLRTDAGNARALERLKQLQGIGSGRVSPTASSVLPEDPH
jgi:tetratricopeptide (TPR) repeat protein